MPGFLSLFVKPFSPLRLMTKISNIAFQHTFFFKRKVCAA